MKTKIVREVLKGDQTINPNFNHIKLFRNLCETDKKKLSAISSVNTFEKGNVLFFEGDTPKKLYLLLEGIVKIYRSDSRGNEIVLHFFQSQTLIAETAHMQRMLYPATAVCETGCKVLAIDYAPFEAEFLRNPDISFKIIHSLSNKLKELQDVISFQLTMNTFERICRFIYENETHISELSHKNIAAILNIVPETLSRNLVALKRDNIITVEKRKIVLLQKEKLRELIDMNQ